MRFIIGEDCGGYYKLECGESLEDFSECQCGGTLRYAQSFKEVIQNRNIATKRCTYCGFENKGTDTICAKCGRKLQRIERSIHDYPSMNKKSRIGNYPTVASQKSYHVGRTRKTDVSILDRISFLGVLAGTIFLIIASFIAAFGFIGSVASSNGADIFRSLGGFLIVFIFAIIASGFIASYISGAEDYMDGILNGGLVGLVFSLLEAFFTLITTMIFDVVMGIVAGVITFIVYAVIYGSLTVIGGLVAVWLRNKMEVYWT
ncbi:MAG: hypothetical protein ACP5OJ_02510 [Methanothermobacter sp.]